MSLNSIVAFYSIESFIFIFDNLGAHFLTTYLRRREIDFLPILVDSKLRHLRESLNVYINLTIIYESK